MFATIKAVFLRLIFQSRAGTQIASLLFDFIRRNPGIYFFPMFLLSMIIVVMSAAFILIYDLTGYNPYSLITVWEKEYLFGWSSIRQWVFHYGTVFFLALFALLVLYFVTFIVRIGFKRYLLGLFGQSPKISPVYALLQGFIHTGNILAFTLMNVAFGFLDKIMRSADSDGKAGIAEFFVGYRYSGSWKRITYLVVPIFAHKYMRITKAIKESARLTASNDYIQSIAAKHIFRGISNTIFSLSWTPLMLSYTLISYFKLHEDSVLFGIVHKLSAVMLIVFVAWLVVAHVLMSLVKGIFRMVVCQDVRGIVTKQVDPKVIKIAKKIAQGL